MAPSTLLGPPEIYQSVVAVAATTIPTPTHYPYIDHLVANYKKVAAGQENPPMGETYHRSPTFLSTGNPCLDLFFHVVPGTPAEHLNVLLEVAWDQDPLKALKLVGNLRGVGGTGKCDKEGFYTAALWLHKNHPKTLASNLASFTEFGNFKDLLEILFRLLEGAKERSSNYNFPRGRRQKKVEGRQLSREKKRMEKAKKVVDTFNRDPNFKFLHDCVSDVFAQCLRLDLKVLDCGDLGKISSAAKWCPSLDSKFDRTTLLCESIAKKVFPREEYPEYEGIEEAHYAYRVRDRLRKHVLAPLRKALLPEEDKKSRLLPHEIIAALDEVEWKRMVEEMGKMKDCVAICDVSARSPVEVSVALGVLVSELCQGPWKGKLITFSNHPRLQLVRGESLREKMGFVRRINKGVYGNNLQKVFDVLLKVAVKGKLRGEEMVKRVLVFSDMGFDSSSRHFLCQRDLATDYEEIEKKFREKGYGDCVPEIVFWNLRDSAASPKDNSLHRGNFKATPVLGNQPRVALVSGYSKNLMGLFTEENGAILDPEAVMEAAISGEEYQRLVVVD
ncbi:hypothetical protein ACS0TY_032758 [Phlomoides rotata]